MAHILLVVDALSADKKIFIIYLQTHIYKMKTKPGFKLRNVCGERIIVAEGKENIDFSKIISMNESAAFLWSAIEGKEFTENDLVSLLTGEYNIDAHTAAEDVKAIVKQWEQAGITEA